MANKLYCLVPQEEFLLLSRDKELTGETYRVLMVCYGNLEGGNIIRLRNVDISESLGMNRASVSRAIKILTSKGIISKVKVLGKPKHYRLNSNYFLKCKVIKDNE